MAGHKIGAQCSSTSDHSTIKVSSLWVTGNGLKSGHDVLYTKVQQQKDKEIQPKALNASTDMNNIHFERHQQDVYRDFT